LLSRFLAFSLSRFLAFLLSHFLAFLLSLFLAFSLSRFLTFSLHISQINNNAILLGAWIPQGLFLVTTHFTLNKVTVCGAGP
jgi:hypothetical protein